MLPAIGQINDSQTQAVEVCSSELNGADPEAPCLPANNSPLCNLVFPDGFIPGTSPAIVDICARISAIARSDINVLFTGETGTGKEMFARMLHLSGKRSNGPFVAVNCAAIPASLMEAELFGIGDRVATGVSKRAGKFQAADGGTLFLDELEAFPYELQAKILRAIETKAVTPVGETRAISSDFRLIAASNRDPDELLSQRLLRDDLYFRIATVEFRLPALRERKQDLQPLVLGMLKTISATEGKTLAGISKRLMTLLLNYSYPGNIRELNNMLQAMVAMAPNGEILDTHLCPERLRRPVARQTVDEVVQQCLQKEIFDLREEMDALTKIFVLRALQFHGGNVRKAAEHMNLTEFGLRKMLKRLGIGKSAGI